MTDKREIRLVKAIAKWANEEMFLAVKGRVKFVNSHNFYIKNKNNNTRTEHEFFQYKKEGFTSPEDAAREFVDRITNDLATLCWSDTGKIVLRSPFEIYFRDGLQKSKWTYYARLAIVNMQEGDIIEYDPFVPIASRLEKQ